MLPFASNASLDSTQDKQIKSCKKKTNGHKFDTQNQAHSDLKKEKT